MADADHANLLDRDWKPRRLRSPWSAHMAALSFLAARASWEMFWDLVASILAPLASFALGLAAIHDRHGICLAFYLLLAIAILWFVATWKKWRHRLAAFGPLQGERLRLHRILADLVSESFREHGHCRATWFREDRFLGVLYPFVRYAPGLSGVPHSRVIWPRRVSYTGLAWNLPEIPIVYDFPVFQTLEEMFKHYEEDIGIPRKLARRVSREMKDTRHIVSIGLCEPTGHRRFLGVLSVDVFKEHVTPFDWQVVTGLPQFQEMVARLRDFEMSHREWRSGG